MTHEEYRRFWEKVDRRPLEQPIAWTCPTCAYPGLITRRCDVPGFCPYCGSKVPGGMWDELRKLMLADVARVENKAFADWWNEGSDARAQAVAQ